MTKQLPKLSTKVRWWYSPLALWNLAKVTTWLGYDIFFENTDRIMDVLEIFCWCIKLFNVLENSDQSLYPASRYFTFRWMAQQFWSRALTFQKNCFIQFNESPLKIMKNILLYHVKSSFPSRNIYIFVLTFCLCRIKLSENLWRLNLVKKQLQYTYCPILYELKATRQWNSVH